MNDVAEQLGSAQPLQILKQAGDVEGRSSAITSTAHKSLSSIEVKIIGEKEFCPPS